LSIEDKGSGFDVNQAVKAAASNGLLGMRERVELLHGTFEILSSAGAGTRVSISIPLPSKKRTD
jgi:signal transduction histidine kinase